VKEVILMKYHSTRDKNIKVSAAEAIAAGIAPDGGLYIPETLPRLSVTDLESMLNMDYAHRAAYLLSMYLDEFTYDELLEIAAQAYSGESFSAYGVTPLIELSGDRYILELFHGPTCAFKDMALQFLPRLLMSSLKKNGETRQVCILTATSGDTGKAALEGFRDIDGIKIAVFYPQDGVSKIQQLQMTTQQGANVFVSAVAGNFDDCQSAVKKVFTDREVAQKASEMGYILSSANSINWGRLMPQIVYYISSYLDWVKQGGTMGERINFCVPTGNFGNILAAWYAKEMGFPIGKLICASNINKVLTDFFNTGIYDVKREFYTTISPSMDILVSSNLERLLYGVSQDDVAVRNNMRKLSESGSYEADAVFIETIRRDIYARYCNDEDAMKQIKETYDSDGYLMDPHTAVGMKVLEDYRSSTGDTAPVVLTATASPFKFAGSVIDALGCKNTSDDKITGEIECLSKVTGLNAPIRLKELENSSIRFDGSIKKDDVRQAVEDFLKTK
jgi:threonine synthase